MNAKADPRLAGYSRVTETSCPVKAARRLTVTACPGSPGQLPLSGPDLSALAREPVPGRGSELLGV